jgi:putative ABC transport system ATP-binding protein
VGSSLYTFDDVSVAPNGIAILDGVSAEVPDQGITGIVGPSGSGKTTLLRLCNRLEVPIRGRVVFRGTAVTDIDPLQLRHDAGMVFQLPTLFGGTVRDNLLVAKADASEAEMELALEGAELAAAFLDRHGDELSGGEAQRACVARTLIAGPEVLLCDEVTSSLDAAPRIALERTARRLADDGMPVLWVTHDLDQARRIADYLLVLIAGRVRYAGTPSDANRAAGDVMEFLDAG